MYDLFTCVLETSLYGGIIIAFVLLLRLVLRKAPRWMICLLWLLAAVRLLCPFQLESRFSLQPDLTPVPQVQTQDTPEQVIPMVPAIPDNVILPEGEDVQIDLRDDSVVVEFHQAIEWRAIAAYVWAAVTAGMVLYCIAACLRLKHRVREAVKLADDVYECAGLDTAFVLGYLWPRIYIPMGLNDPKYIVDHERAHIQRGDHWLKLLMFAALALHWFNPLVWVAYICMCRDVEMACDERVVRDFGPEQRKAYAAALLACSTGRRSFAACPVAFGEVSVKSRIMGVLHYQKPRFWICLIAVLAIVIVAVCFMTNPLEMESTHESDDMSNTEWTGGSDRMNDDQPSGATDWWRAPNEIYVYPFSDDDIHTAISVIEDKLNDFAKEPGVLSYQVEAIAFDPMTTDNFVLSYCDNTGEGLTTDDFYPRCICFCVTYRAIYDHDETFMEDVSRGRMEFTLIRESTSSEWEYWGHGSPRSDYPAMLLAPEEWQSFEDTTGKTVAVYRSNEGTDDYWKFVRTSDGQRVVFVLDTPMR